MDAAAPPVALSRPDDGRVVAGVAAGLARRLDVDPLVVRVAFVALVAASGIGVLLYAVAWLLMPTDAAAAAPGRRRLPALPVRWGPGTGRVTGGIGLLVLSLLLALRELGVWWSDTLTWPAVLAAAGAALLWRVTLARDEEEASGAAAAPPPRRVEQRRQLQAAYRGGFGVALIVGAGLLFLYASGALRGSGGDAVLAALVFTLALALILAPLWWGLVRKLARERAQRIRSQERAEVAAHLHDSVLQTLALVQRRADDPREVAALARRQERELRAWLWDGEHADAGATVASALRSAAAEVEDAHGVAVEVVDVGDAPLGEHGEALVAAAREAMVNAAKFAGSAGPVDVYAEFEAGRAHVFVRDRGPGFAPGAVPPDRRGVRESIVGRMERHGGTATIREATGAGTEVELAIALDGAAP